MAKLLSVIEVARMVKTTKTTVYNEILAGRLKPIRKEKPYLFQYAEVRRWLTSKTWKTAKATAERKTK